MRRNGHILQTSAEVYYSERRERGLELRPVRDASHPADGVPPLLRREAVGAARQALLPALSNLTNRSALVVAARNVVEERGLLGEKRIERGAQRAERRLLRRQPLRVRPRDQARHNRARRGRARDLVRALATVRDAHLVVEAEERDVGVPAPFRAEVGERRERRALDIDQRYMLDMLGGTASHKW